MIADLEKGAGPRDRRSPRSHYDVLGVSAGAGHSEIRLAFEHLSAVFDPDSLALYSLAEPEEQRRALAEVREANRVLSDPGLRQAYDEEMGFQAPRMEPAQQELALGSQQGIQSWRSPWIGAQAEEAATSAGAGMPADLQTGLVSAGAAGPGELQAEPEGADAADAADASELQAAPESAGNAEPPEVQAASAIAGTPEPADLQEPPAIAGAAGAEVPQTSPGIEAETVADEEVIQLGEADVLEILEPAAEPAQPALPPIEADTEFDGALLQAVREARGLTRRQVWERTRIGVNHIQNIEEENFGLLPSRVFLRGFLQSLAKEFGLDPARVSETYLRRRESGHIR